MASPAQGTARYAFISHSSKDAVKASRIRIALEESGIRCWIAPRDVKPGRYAESIVEGLESSSHFILVYSRNSIESKDVQNEIHHAHKLGLVILPVRIEEVEPNRFSQYFLGAHHWLDAIGSDFDNGIQRVVSFVRDDANVPIVPDELTPRKRFKTSPKLLIAALAIAIIAVGSFYFSKLSDTDNGEFIPASIFPSKWHGTYSSKKKETELLITFPQNENGQATAVFLSRPPAKHTGSVTQEGKGYTILFDTSNTKLSLGPPQDFGTSVEALLTGEIQCDGPFTMKFVEDEFTDQ